MVFTLEAAGFASFSEELTRFVKHRAPTLSGFVEALVLGDEAQNRVVVVSQWDSRESWSAAQWEEDVGRSLAVLIETTTSFEVHGYEPLAVVRPG